MERNALQNLIDWNNSKRRKPLIIRGARQVGKTYLIKDIFADSYYKDSYIYVDFKKDDEICDFCSKTADAKKSSNTYPFQKASGLPKIRF